MITVHVGYVWFVTIVTGFLGIAWGGLDKHILNLIYKVILLASSVLGIFYLFVHYGA